MSGMDRLTDGELKRMAGGLFNALEMQLLDDLGSMARELIAHRRASQAAPAPSALVKALRTAEAALSDIGDAEREEGDDLAWCEGRAAKALPLIRPVLRAALITTPAPSDGLREAAAGALASLDSFMSGAPINPESKAQSDALARAASFASEAYRQGYDHDQATHAMLRAFLTALVDPLHPDLDYLRADPAAGTIRAALSVSPAQEGASDGR